MKERPISDPNKCKLRLWGKLLVNGFLLLWSALAIELQLIASPGDDWQDKIIYFTVLDRFENGDPSNDSIYGDKECNDELNPSSYQGGDLLGLRRRLSAIQELGANAIWITPLYTGVESKEGNNCGFTGYWADFKVPYSLEIDPRFGMASDFDELLADGKSRGISTILDMVVNHAGYGAQVFQQHPSWFHNEADCARWGSKDVFCPLAGLPDFNHRVPEVSAYLIDLHKQWINRFDIDGIRMDTVKHVEPAYFDKWTRSMREAGNNLFIFGELLDEQSYGEFTPYLNSGFDGLFNFPLRRSLVETFALGNSVDVVASRVKEFVELFGQVQSRWFVNLLDNHDVPRFMEEFPSYLDAQIVHERYKLALTALLSIPGIPQIYYGNEVGMYGGKDPANRKMMPDWAFEPTFHEKNHIGFVQRPGEVWAHLKRLIEIRKQRPALTRGDFDEIWRQSNPRSPNVWAFIRTAPKVDQDELQENDVPVFIAINNGEERSGQIRMSLRGHFKDGEVLQSVSLDFDQATAELDSSEKYFVVRDGAIEVEIGKRRALILTPGGSQL